LNRQKIVERGIPKPNFYYSAITASQSRIGDQAKPSSKRRQLGDNGVPFRMQRFFKRRKLAGDGITLPPFDLLSRGMGVN